MTKKNYTVEIAFGRFELSLKGTDGRTHSVNVPYPFVEMELNEKTGEYEPVKRTRKQTEEYCIKQLQIKGALI